MMRRSTFLPLLGLPFLAAAAPSHATKMVTYRDSGCGCCEGWVMAARRDGFDVTMHDLDRGKRLDRFGLIETTAGCHTSLVAGYVVEGHVPLSVISRLLRERPRFRGITVPGMPTGVPGMESPRSAPLDVLTLEAQPRLYERVT